MSQSASEKPSGQKLVSPVLEKTIYRNWGIYINQREKPDVALSYLNKANESNPDDYVVLYSRGQCNRNLANPKAALIDSEKAIALKHNNFAKVQLQKCDALLESNEFESCKQNLHANIQNLSNYANLPFPNRLGAVDSIFKDCLGSNYGHFLYVNLKLIPKMYQAKKDDRPLWKILSAEEKCDTTSVREEEEELVSPREIARRERAYKVFNQIYFNKSWKDAIFLKELKTNPKFLLENANGSTPILEKLLCNKYAEVKTNLRMLHARSPLYNELKIRFPNIKLNNKHKESFLYRVQYQTRRNMISILRKIKLLRKEGQIEHLSKFVEELLGDYVVLKTHRVMPWKFEFVNEVLNILALTHIDMLSVPEIDAALSSQKFGSPNKLKSSDVQKSEFGNKNQYIKDIELEKYHTNLRLFILRLEKRILFAEYAVEKCYLFFEIARCYFKLKNFEGCVVNARNSLEEAEKAKSNIWCFLSLLQTLKSHTFLKKLELKKKTLEKLMFYAEKLREPKLQKFVTFCQTLNEEDMNKQYKTGTLSLKRKSKLSVISKYSFETSKSVLSSINIGDTTISEHQSNEN